jgi:hypothetical protein
MNLSAQTINGKNQQLVLVVDKTGILGERLAQSLSQDYLVIFVSKIFPSENKNIVHIPFKGKIPQVPDNKYEMLFIIDDESSITKESVISFITLARGSQASLYFLTSIRSIDSKHAESITGEYAGTKVLVFGDIFDKTTFFDKNSSINRFILQSRKNKRIDIPGAGLSLSFPITLDDTIKLILKAAHLNLPEKTLLLFPQTPTTDISLAHVFQRVEPEITIDFTKETKEKKIYIPQSGAHVITKYDLEQKIKELDLGSPENRKITLVENRVERRSILKPFLLILLIVLFVLLLPLISTIGYSSLGYFELNNAKGNIEKGNLDSARKNVGKSITFFSTSSKTADILISESKYAGLSHESQSLKQKVESAKDLSQATEYFLDGATAIRGVYVGKSTDPSGDFQTASESFKSAITLSQKVKAEGAMPKDFETKLTSMRPLIDLFANSSEILPGVLGFDKEKTYLVIFQNNQNLRPGGGHVDSVGVLKIKNAKVQSFTIKSVLDLDKKFSSHVEPPYAIRRYIPQLNWNLSESNFSPDFVRSAISASNFYSVESGEKVDGVIAVDETFLSSVLSLTGPISVESQVVSKDSLSGLLRSQGGSVLGEVGKSIVINLQSNKKISAFSLVQKAGDSIASKDLLFAFKDSGMQNVFTANGWSGSLWDNRQNSKGVVNDSLGLYEANFGNKNLEISRSMSKKTVIGSNGVISSRLQIAYKNSDAKEAYKNYVQLVLPQGATLNAILVNNSALPIQKAVTDFFVYESRGFKAPGGIEVNQTMELGKSIYGFLLNIPAGEVQTVAVDYDLPQEVENEGSGLTYSLKIYKQPGVNSYPFDLSFELPQDYQVISGKSPLSTSIAKDEEFIYKISQR